MIHNMSDYHIHTYFSSDSEEHPENIVNTALQRGLKEICFTDHIDLDFPEKDENGNPLFVFDIKKYFDILCDLKQNTQGLNVKIGVEIGLVPYLSERNNQIVSSAPFDFIIGSTHLVGMQDPYYPEFWEGKNPDKIISRYFEATYENIKEYNNYDVYGHLDYISRYVPDKNYKFDVKKYMDIIDCILRKIIENGHGIEINTSPFVKGLSETNPSEPVIRRYRELGGEIITTGSDAHKHQNVACSFHIAKELLLSCGFKYYCTYSMRTPEFIKLQ